LIFACTPEKKSAVEPSEKLFTKLEADQTGIDFINEVQDDEFFNILTYRNFYNGGGVAIGDINNDGFADIYFTANMQPNRLYLNKGNWRFQEIAESSGVTGSRGWSTGVTMADVNGDGLLDIYVCNSGDIEGDNRENELFINNGDLTFSEQSAKYNLNDPGFTTHASFFDYDLDGDLDCYILNNSFKNPDKISAFANTREEKDDFGGDKLFRNDGDTFTNVTNEAGIYNSAIGFGLGVSVSDLNGDMLPDLYISNDFWERDYLYYNQGNGKFSEELTGSVSISSLSSMGADIADLNNDGYSDIYTTDMLPSDNYRLKTMTIFDPYHLEEYKFRASYHYQILQNCLQLNNGRGKFQETAHLSGVGATDWSWGALIFDFDNNGWKDIYVCNGITREIMYLDFTNFISDKEEVRKIVTEKGKFDWRDFAEYMPSSPLSNFAFVNDENPVIPSFANQADELGLAEPGFSNGAAYGDLDNDGDMDLIVNNVNMPAFVYQNNSTNNYLKIKFQGKELNRFGVGAKVRVAGHGWQQVMQHYPSRGFESAVEPGILFGLGNIDLVDTLEVIWPDKSKQLLSNVAVNQSLTLDQEAATEMFVPQMPGQPALFVRSDLIRGESKHQENVFNDFDRELLLPRMFSTEGPKIIRGDINGDGLEDFIAAGSTDDPDKLFVNRGAYWERSTSSSWNKLVEEDRQFETTCGAIFDLDGDGDNDILLGAGGNDLGKGIEGYKLRYYENKGNENFIRNIEKTPPAAGNFSCIIPDDFNNDGQTDLFIGARIVPGNYGLTPRSFLLENRGAGIYQDVTTESIGTLGMVCDALWMDIDGDNDRDLIVVGEWMRPTVLENEGGQMRHSSWLVDSPGWWTAIESADLDHDGREDLVLGNWGLNTRLKANEQKPLSIYVKDFDHNGKTEFIINWFPGVSEQSYPFASKMDITQQMPNLKKENLKYEDYAHRTYESLLPEEARKNALTYTATNMQTSVLWNDDSTFSLQPLPIAAQVSPVFGIAAHDFDNDGVKDIWLGGNFYGLKPEMGRHNSSKGIYLKGEGNRQFKYIAPERSGIEVSGEVRDVEIFKSNNGEISLVVARNNDTLLVYTLR